MSDILSTIVAKKHEEVCLAKQSRPLTALQSIINHLPAPLDFVEALRKKIDGGGIAVIAEIKKASPSKGIIREDFDPVAIAKDYEAHGATCLSVLTDAPFFQGALSYLEAVRDAVTLPLLRKDFMVDNYQIVEARAAGADAILLIATCLDDTALTTLHQSARSLGLSVLIEVHDKVELDRVLTQKQLLDNGTVIGVNNRNLKTFSVSLDTIIHLQPHIPKAHIGICESGIYTPDDIHHMRTNGIDCFLIGESLMRSPSPGKALQNLLS